MSTGWSADFSYAYLEQLLADALELLPSIRFSEVREESLQDSRGVLLRHDVDLSLERAMKVAEIEHELGLSATYMVMTTCPFYQIEDPASQSMLTGLQSLGHEVELHFDTAPGHSDPSIDLVVEQINEQCERLARATGEPVLSLSLHRPQPGVLRGPLRIAGRINAYAARLMEWYLSDSKGSWRAGNPVSRLAAPQGAVLQLLIHPIWWGKEHLPASDHLEAFYRQETAGCSKAERELFDANLAAILPRVLRSGLTLNKRE